MVKLCECGCGGDPGVYVGRGPKKGQPRRFITGHNAKGSLSHTWNGGFSKRSGYRLKSCPGHPRADPRGYVPEHILLAEAALGRYLPLDSEVHHINEVKTDNRNSNLVICQDRSYHSLLHRRMRAIKGCGNPDWRKCKFCKTYDNPTVMACGKNGPNPLNKQYFHAACSAEYKRPKRRKWKAAQKEKRRKKTHGIQ